MSDNKRWKISLHGGHSGGYCEHATGALRDILEAAVEKSFHTYALTEHAPRTEDRFLYPTEVELGWDVERLVKNFENYAQESKELSEEFSDRIVVLRGFEIEVVPESSYVADMLRYREEHDFDFIVGSVHYVGELPMDFTPQLYAEAVELHGGIEPLAVHYYQTLAEMVKALNPEVVGHLDVIRKFAGPHGPVDTPAIREEAARTVDLIVEHDGIIDINTAGYRKGFNTPYPDPWLLKIARDRNAQFCFGDDSHCPEEVGAGIEEARKYLLDNGITELTTLAKEDGEIVRNKVSLL